MHCVYRFHGAENSFGTVLCTLNLLSVLELWSAICIRFGSWLLAAGVLFQVS